MAQVRHIRINLENIAQGTVRRAAVTYQPPVERADLTFTAYRLPIHVDQYDWKEKEVLAAIADTSEEYEVAIPSSLQARLTPEKRQVQEVEQQIAEIEEELAAAEEEQRDRLQERREALRERRAELPTDPDAFFLQEGRYGDHGIARGNAAENMIGGRQTHIISTRFAGEPLRKLVREGYRLRKGEIKSRMGRRKATAYMSFGPHSMSWHETATYEGEHPETTPAFLDWLGGLWDDAKPADPAPWDADRVDGDPSLTAEVATVDDPRSRDPDLSEAESLGAVRDLL